MAWAGPPPREAETPHQAKRTWSHIHPSSISSSCGHFDVGFLQQQKCSCVAGIDFHPSFPWSPHSQLRQGRPPTSPLLPGFGGVKLFGSSTERRTGVWRVGVETSAQNAKFEKRKHVISIRTRNEDEGEGPCFLHLHALMF